MCMGVEKLVYNQRVGRIVQLVRTPLLHRGGRRFESYSAHRRAPRSRGFFIYEEAKAIEHKY